MPNPLLDLEACKIYMNSGAHEYSSKTTPFQTVAEKTIMLYDALQKSVTPESPKSLENKIGELFSQLNSLPISNKEEFNCCNMLKYKLTACEYLLGDRSDKKLHQLTSFSFSKENSNTLFANISGSITFAEAEELRKKRSAAECTIL